MTINTNWDTCDEGKEPGAWRETHQDDLLEGVTSHQRAEGRFREPDTGQCAEALRQKALADTGKRPADKVGPEN